MANYTGRKVLLKDEDDNAIIPYVDGVIDSNTSNTVKTWTGTREQYNAISTKDSNTLYYITDDESIYKGTEFIAGTPDLSEYAKSSDLISTLSAIYPVGSTYISTTNSCPMASIIPNSTWTQIASNVVVSVNTNVPVKGNNLSLGITNGSLNAGLISYGEYGRMLGATKEQYGASIPNTLNGATIFTNGQGLGITTDASKSGIVGTVTRTNLTLYIFKRTA